MEQNAWTKQRVIVLLSLLAIAVAIEDRLVVPTTQSIPYHLLFMSSGPGHKGDYVNFDVDGRVVGKREKKRTLTKRVTCMEGETLRFEEGAHYCGDQLVDRVLQFRNDGVPLKPFIWNGPIPDGKVFVTGSHARSYDSRYFGFIDVASTRKVIPLF